ncbi:hypothetical protein ACP70R_040080 [Stipagrostis hirtigluma subsp. patula]
MRTRLQSQQQTGRNKGKSDPHRSKVKRQIQATDLSSTGSSSSPYQLRKRSEHMRKGKGKGVHTGNGKGVRRWKRIEEDYLVELTKDKKLAPLYKNWKDRFYDVVSQRLNDRFKGNSEYVPFDRNNVMHKIRHSKKCFDRAEQAGMLSSETLYGKFGFASSASVGAPEEETFDHVSAVKYLNKHGCPNVDLYKFATLLKDDSVLLLFNVKETYSERIEMLKELVKSKTPCDSADGPAGASSS